jgi:hypothetical protein
VVRTFAAVLLAVALASIKAGGLSGSSEFCIVDADHANEAAIGWQCGQSTIGWSYGPAAMPPIGPLGPHVTCSVGTTPCGATPAQRQTWGQIKSLWR